MSIEDRVARARALFDELAPANEELPQPPDLRRQTNRNGLVRLVSTSTMADEAMSASSAGFPKYSSYFYGGKKRKLSKAAVALAKAADAEIRRAKFAENVAQLQSVISGGDAADLEAIITDPDYKTSKVTGSGAYGLSRFVKDTRKLLGNRIINAANQRIASGIAGGGLYTARGLYGGRGLYSANNLVTGGRPSMTFESANDETQSLVLTHKEYVGDVFAPATAVFTNTSYSLNPGLQQNFPFLSQFAQNFEEYELIQMLFEFHSTVDASAINNTSGNTGTIVMATNYKADAQPFITKEEMIQYHGGVSGRLTEDLIHGIECDPSKNALGSSKFIRGGPVSNSDLKLYDIGNFQLALQNIPSAFYNQQVGELWVHYKVKLMKPKLYTSLGNSIVKFCALSNGTGETVPIPFGTDILTAQANNLPMSLTQPGAAQVALTFPAATSGIFRIQLQIEGTGFSIGSTGATNLVSLSGNVIGWSDIYATSSEAGSGPTYVSVAATSTNLILIVDVYVRSATTGVNNTVTCIPFGLGGVASTVTSSYVEVFEIGSSFATSSTIAKPIWVNSSGAITSPI